MDRGFEIVAALLSPAAHTSAWGNKSHIKGTGTIVEVLVPHKMFCLKSSTVRVLAAPLRVSSRKRNVTGVNALF